MQLTALLENIQMICKELVQGLTIIIGDDDSSNFNEIHRLLLLLYCISSEFREGGSEHVPLGTQKSHLKRWLFFIQTGALIEGMVF